MISNNSFLYASGLVKLASRWRELARLGKLSPESLKKLNVPEGFQFPNSKAINKLLKLEPPPSDFDVAFTNVQKYQPRHLTDAALREAAISNRALESERRLSPLFQKYPVIEKRINTARKINKDLRPEPYSYAERMYRGKFLKPEMGPNRFSEMLEDIGPRSGKKLTFAPTPVPPYSQLSKYIHPTWTQEAINLAGSYDARSRKLTLPDIRQLTKDYQTSLKEYPNLSFFKKLVTPTPETLKKRIDIALAIAKHEKGHAETLGNPELAYRYANPLVAALKKLDPRFAKKFDLLPKESVPFLPILDQPTAIAEALAQFRGTNKFQSNIGGRTLVRVPIDTLRDTSYPLKALGFDPSVALANAEKHFGHNPALRDRLLSTYAQLMRNYGFTVK